MSAGQQAAGVRCQNVCSYFPQTKIRLWTFSTVTQTYSNIQAERKQFSSHSRQPRTLDGKQNQLTTKHVIIIKY